MRRTFLLLLSFLWIPPALAAEIPTELRAAYQRAIYNFETVPGGYHAGNPANRVTAEFRGAATALQAGGVALNLAVSGYGWGERLAEPGAVTSSVAHGERLERIYANGLREWFVNKPQGLEQGFVIPQRGGKGMLRLRLSADAGWQVTANGAGIQFQQGDVRLDYGGLQVRDARGVAQPARLLAGDRAVEIEVEDGSAVYPLTIDPVYSQQAELTGADGAAGDLFGSSVSLSSDGSTALIGAFGKTISANPEQGAAYVFTRSGSTWTQQAELTASDGAALDAFGYSVSLSSDGNTALIGALGKTIPLTRQGAAYVFTRSGSTWTQQQELIAADGAANEQFGASVSLSGDAGTALIVKSGSANQLGAAYIFTRSGSTWTLQQELASSDAVGSEGFQSASLSSDGNTALVGAIDKHISANAQQGAAYVFTRTGSTWAQQAELTASDGAAFDLFGRSSLSGDGNTALIGASGKSVNGVLLQGAAYVFTRTGSTWTQQAELAGSDGANGDSFGSSVALSNDGNTALVGACYKTARHVDQGAAYVFTRSGNAWLQIQELVALDGVAEDNFGCSTGLTGNGNAALIGALNKKISFHSNQGAAYVWSLPPAVITNLSRTSATAGTKAAMGLTVYGQNFLPGSVVYFGGAAVTTTYVDSTQLTAVVPAADMTTPGPVNVTVDSSAPFTFTLLAPVLTSMTPSSTTAGGAAFGLTLYGSNFLINSVVYFGKTALTTTWLGTSLTATVPASAIAAAGTVTVTVQNGPLAISNALTFSANPPAPTISSLSPAFANQNAPGFTLTIYGSRFVSNASVHLGATALTTTFVNSGQLTATVPTSALAISGNMNVTVTNPPGATSPPATFQVRATSITLSPGNIASGSGDFLLTVTGTNFNAGSTIMWGATPLTTNYINSTTLTATVTAAQVAASGTVRITVVTNGGTSAGVLFTIN